MNWLRNISIAFTALASSAFAAPVYETLEYGDSKETVIEKLTECPRITGEYVVSMFGSTELDECFKVAQGIGKSKFSLLFGWSEDKKLNRIDLRSNPFTKDQYYSELKQTFDEAVRIGTRIYGKPELENTLPETEQFTKDPSIVCSHIWQLEEGSLLFGVTMREGNYHLFYRFSQKRISSQSS